MDKPQKKYRIYIDEVGNSDLGSSDNPNHRFLSLTGVILELGYVATTLHPQREALKTKYFNSHPDSPAILHRKELVNRRPPFEALRDEATRKAFDKELLGLLESWDYYTITVCIDKKEHKETYTAWRYDPYHYCMAVLLERFVFFLDSVGCQDNVMTESRGGKDDRRLKKSYTQLWEQGTPYLPPDRFQARLASKNLFVKPKSNNISGLQLADILAHPSRCDILREKDLLGRPMPAFGKKVVAVLATKYYQSKGQVFGKKFL